MGSYTASTGASVTIPRVDEADTITAAVDAPPELSPVSVTILTHSAGSGSGKVHGGPGDDSGEASDGATPVAVEAGGSVDVTVYVGPLSTSRAVLPLYSATLNIRATKWSIHVPVRVVTHGVQTIATTRSVVIRQGDTASVGLHISNGGPETDVWYSINASGAGVRLSPSPTGIHVAAARIAATAGGGGLPGTTHGGSTPTILPTTMNAGLLLTAPASAPVGPAMLNIQGSAFDGAEREYLPGIPIRVDYGPAAVGSISSGFEVFMGDSFAAPVSVRLAGTRTQINFSVDPASGWGLTVGGGDWITLDTPSVTVATASGFETDLRFRLSSRAKPGKGKLRVNWSAYDGAQRGTIEWDLTVKDVVHTWSVPSFGGDTVSCNDTIVTVKSSGTAVFSFNLYEGSIISGDYYSMIFAFTNPAGSPVYKRQGKLSPKDNIHATITNPSPDPWIASNWQEIFASSGIHYHLEQQDATIKDIGDALSDLWEDIKKWLRDHDISFEVTYDGESPGVSVGTGSPQTQ